MCRFVCNFGHELASPVSTFLPPRPSHGVMSAPSWSVRDGREAETGDRSSWWSTPYARCRPPASHDVNVNKSYKKKKKLWVAMRPPRAGKPRPVGPRSVPSNKQTVGDELRRSAGWRAQTEVANSISQRAARVAPVIGNGVVQKPDLGSDHGWDLCIKLTC